MTLRWHILIKPGLGGWMLVRRLLDTERYGLAGLLLWDPALFNSEPKAVRQLFQTVRSTQNLMRRPPHSRFPLSGPVYQSGTGWRRSVFRFFMLHFHDLDQEAR
jgi:hypothetical protein